MQARNDSTIAQEQAWNSQQLAAPVTAPSFRLWTYRAPAIVLGCSQRALLPVAEARLPPGTELVQRPSGGGAVLAGPWLVSLSVVLPTAHPWVSQGLVDSYRELGLLHARVLADLGVPAQALPAADVAQANASMGPAVDWACYGSLAPWELTDVRNRKLVGLAQRRQRNGILLVAGTLVTVPDWALLCDALGHPEDAAEMQRRTVCCEELARRPVSMQAVVSGLEQALCKRLQGGADPK